MFLPQEEGGAPSSPFVSQFLPIRANVDDGTFSANIRAAVARGLPELALAKAHDRRAIVIGGGPSLAKQIDSIKGHAKAGHSLVALNGSAAWLHAHGLTPEFHILLDARPHMARFVISEHKGRTDYLVASQCSPRLFDVLDDAYVTLWHPHVEGVAELAPEGAVMIGGGTTVGLQALSILYTLGYRKMHLYGFDSCYADDAGHAYAQPENDGEPVIEVEFGGRRFRAAPWMVRQADEFRHVLLELVNADCEIAVAGDGLIPHITRMMTMPMHPSAYCYNLAEAPASWDFSEWLIEAERDRRARGAPAPLRVAFAPGPNSGFRADDLPWSPEQRQRFLDSTMRPLLRLIGAIEDPAAIVGRRHHYYAFKGLGERGRSGERLPRFEPAASAVAALKKALGIERAPIVITLREASHWPQRNSNLEAWKAFARARQAEGHRVIFVRDTEKACESLDGFETAPIASVTVDNRCAFYALALCNMGVCNGPLSLALFGGMPYLMFKPLVEGWANGVGTPEWWRDNLGVPQGSQFAWSTSEQRIVWADDDLASIEAAWADWLADRAQLAFAFDNGMFAGD